MKAPDDATRADALSDRYLGEERAAVVLERFQARLCLACGRNGTALMAGVTLCSECDLRDLEWREARHRRRVRA
jgi:hypothetical protein